MKWRGYFLTLEYEVALWLPLKTESGRSGSPQHGTQESLYSVLFPETAPALWSWAGFTVNMGDWLGSATPDSCNLRWQLLTHRVAEYPGSMKNTNRVLHLYCIRGGLFARELSAFVWSHRCGSQSKGPLRPTGDWNRRDYQGKSMTWCYLEGLCSRIWLIPMQESMIACFVKSKLSDTWETSSPGLATRAQLQFSAVSWASWLLGA